MRVLPMDHQLDVVEVRGSTPSLVHVALASPTLIDADPTGHAPDELASVRTSSSARRASSFRHLGAFSCIAASILAVLVTDTSAVVERRPNR